MLSILNNISKIIIIIILIVILLILIYLLYKSISNNKQSGSFLTHETVTRWIDQNIEIIHIDYSSYDKSMYLALSNNETFVTLMNDYNNTTNTTIQKQKLETIKNICNTCNIIMLQFIQSINKQLLSNKRHIENYNNFLDKNIDIKPQRQLNYRAINNANYSAFLDHVYTKCLSLYNKFDNKKTITELQKIVDRQNTNILMIDTKYDYITSTRYSIFNYINLDTILHDKNTDIYRSLYKNITKKYSLKCTSKDKIKMHKDIFMLYLTQGIITDYQKARELDGSTIPYKTSTTRIITTSIVEYIMVTAIIVG